MSAANQNQLPRTDGKSEPPDSNLSGYVDAIVSGRIYGWAWDASNPGRAVAVEIRHGEKLIGKVEASRFREDLKNIGVGDGRHAFEFELPDELRDAPSSDINIVFHESGVELARNAPMMLGSDGPEAEPAGASAPEEDPLAGRIRRLEESVSKVAHITLSMHGQLLEQRNMLDGLKTGSSVPPNMERRLDASFAALNRRLDELSKAMSGAETFLLRSDERLREITENLEPREIEPVLKREIRGMGLVLLCAILAVITMLLA